ncbi:MAG: SDR family NAD(P)-dependent oxidoreductase [Chloroflexi bacterium]|nr:SDR family NAD(P)-dependent oxidoreductase [Chloroflexota bacterium]
MVSARLQDKVALVVGAGSRGEPAGTGYATAKLFAEHGASTLLVDNNRERAKVTEREILDAGGAASVFEGDVTSEEDCKAMVTACGERYGRLDILVNNVATAGAGKVTEVGSEELDQVFATNLRSMMLACRYAIPLMKAGGGGSILNISSIDGLRTGMSYNVPYAVTKAGAAHLARLIAVHHGRDNIRANCIAPGHIYAPFVRHMSPEKRDQRRKVAPLGTEGTAWDIAWAAVFLASDEARWISGTILPVDGGLLAATPLAVYDNIVPA